MLCAYCSVVSDSLLLHGLQPARLLCPWGFSRQEACCGLLCPPPGGVFPTQGLNPDLPHCRQILYHLLQGILGSVRRHCGLLQLGRGCYCVSQVEAREAAEHPYNAQELPHNRQLPSPKYQCQDLKKPVLSVLLVLEIFPLPNLHATFS